MAESELSLCVKCLVVGDKGVGKTCMLIVNFVDKFPDEYIPATCDTYVHSLSIGDAPCNMTLLDASRENYMPTLRPIAAPQPDVFLVCFSVDSPTTYDSARELWIPDVKQYCPYAAFMLVGTKCDLRDDPATIEKLASSQQKCVTPEEGRELAQQVGAYSYTECSALTQEGLKRVFEEAALAVLDDIRKRRKRKCIVL